MFIDYNYASDQKAQTHVFTTVTSIGTILKATVLTIVFIDDKHVSNQDAETCVCIIKYFTVIIIKIAA